MSFTQRLINFTITLGPSVPPFAESGTNQLSVSGLRVSAKITQAATPSSAVASIQIYGLTLSLMNQLATVGMNRNLIQKNTIQLFAGDAINGMPQIFFGTILDAWADFQNAPEVPFHIEARTLAAESVIPIKSSSYDGATSVSSVMENLAGQMGCTFENNNINTTLHDPYYYGSATNQANACARAGNFLWGVDQTKTLAIWPRGKSRQTNQPILIAPPPQGEMVNYPTFANFMIICKTVFNAKLKQGQSIQVQSSLKPAVGMWTLFALEHSIESNMPHGEWFSIITANSSSVVAPPLPPLT